MAVSVVRKLERCERLGRASQGEANMLNGENCQVIKYKIKIKDCFTSNQTTRVMKGSLNYVAPSNEEIMSENLPAWRLHNLHAHPACNRSSPSPSPSPPPRNVKLHQIILHEQYGDSGQPPPSSPSLPCMLQQINLHDQGGSQQNLHEDEDEMQLHYVDEDESIWLQHPWKLPDYVLHEHVYSNTSSQESPHQPPLKLQPNTLQENEEAGYARKLKLQTSNEQEEEINWAPWSSQQSVKETSSPRKLQKGTEDEMEQLGSGEYGKAGERPPWKLQKDVQEKAGGGLWERVKKMECECCGMEEECTGGYEEKVRAGLRGHWLCGLCEQAVGEERKRVGGSVQAALAAHMQPCRRFSRRARSKASPPPSDVTVPHAVCRLLCRHLSTPSPRHQPSSSSSSCPSLSRSSSCVPSLPN